VTYGIGVAAFGGNRQLEGFAFDKSGKAYAVTDNDGVDDSSGETLFFAVDLKGTN